MAKVTFSGADKLIVVNNGITELDCKVDLYSDWKEFVISGSNAKFRSAFRVFGGDPLGGDLKAGSFFFLQNQSGSDWRIRPFEGNHELVIVGNLYGEDTTLPLFVSTVGNYTVSIAIERSSLTQLVSKTSAWDYAISGSYASGTFGETMQKMNDRMKQGRIY